MIQHTTTTEREKIKDVLSDSLAKLEEIISGKTKITGVPSGFKLLDLKTTGFQPSEFILIAARPGMGKTSFALNIATNAVIHANIPVAIFSLEMSKNQISNKILSSEPLISNENMKVVDARLEDTEKHTATMYSPSQAHIYIDDTASITVTEIKEKCKRLKLKGQLGLVVIDYLQLIQGNKKESRQKEVSENSRLLKSMAKELNIPVICLSQLSRAPEQRTDHRPILKDLRDLGSIEQSADVVMFLYRDDYYNQETDKKNITECIIAKSRNGSVGTIELGWCGEYMKFINLESDNEKNA